MPAGSERLVVYGAGAIGGVIGARLFQAGFDVVLVARGDHYDTVKRHGLRLVTPDEDVTLPIPVVDDPVAVGLDDDDVVLLTMKSRDTAAGIDQLAKNVPGTISVVCAQNGIENERIALRRLRNVYAANVMCPASHLAPGVVEAHSAPVTGIVDVGRYPGGRDEVSQRLATAFSAAGFDSRVLDDIVRWKYAKLLMNLSNAIEAVCGATERLGELDRLARAEAEACFLAAGIDWTSNEEFQARRGDIISPQPIAGRPRSGASSWQSLARGTGSVETDWLNGEIALLGRLHGVPTPVNALLQRVMNEMSRAGESPGSRTAAELQRELASAESAGGSS